MKRSIIYIIMCMAAILQTTAQTTFRTSELERLATAVSLDAQALPEGWSHPTASSLRLSVHTKDKTIDHIGLCLFSDELRSVGKSPVFDFLERYFLQMKFPPQSKSLLNMIRDDQFRFLTGKPETIDVILTSDNFSFEYDHHRYHAAWSRNGKTLLSVSFPVEYELISGENKIEAEDNLQADIRSTKIVQPSDAMPALKNDSCYSADFTNRLYYLNNELVVSPQHPIESAANMMLSLNAQGSYALNMTQVSYGFRKTVFEVPLRQWIAFCQSRGCELYFGVENMDPLGDVDCVVLAVNTSENYNHVLTVRIPQNVIEAKEGTVEARLYPYVPTHNVLNMFAAYRKSNPKMFVSK